MSQNGSIAMQDKEMLEDVLTSQKQITGLYNTYANECATTAIRDEMMNILHDEHDIQADIFMEMQKRGWYPTPMAEEQKDTNGGRGIPLNGQRDKRRKKKTSPARLAASVGISPFSARASHRLITWL